MPSGLRLDAKTGVVSGTPAEAGVWHTDVTANLSDGSVLAVDACISIFSRDESEIIHGQWGSLSSQGRWSVATSKLTFDWKSSFDGKTRTAELVLYIPDRAAGNDLPLVVHHRGRGFSHNDYSNFLNLVASHGIVCAAISDPESFWDPDDPQAVDSFYDASRAELGKEAALGKALALSQDRSSVVASRIDPHKTFVMGHSRGGGATQASHVRSTTLMIRGAIYLMAFDLRYFTETVAPAASPAYAISDLQPRLPALIVSAELDGDLIYPYADEFIDRSRGPTTFCTIYGACHDYMGNTNSYDIGGAKISRQAEQADVAAMVVAFVRRWAEDDLSVDGLLYGNELENSSLMAVASWRRASPVLLVDDFQDGDPTTNCLGGSNTVSGCRRTEESVYPTLGNLSSLGVKHSVITIGGSKSSFTLDLGKARDLSDDRCLVFRAEQTGSRGWAVGFKVEIVDCDGKSCPVELARADGSLTRYFPSWVSGGSPLNRFLTVRVDLSELERGVDLGSARAIKFTFEQPGGGSTQIVLDDVRVE
jgi:hypothetical protein